MDIVEQVRQNLKEALRYISDRMVGEIDVGIILGSGLGRLVDIVEDPITFPYGEIPHFPRSTTEGHMGNLVIGKLIDKRVAIMQGRFHHYEGYTSAGISFPIRVLKGLGIKTLIITCAAGGIRSDLKQGDIMAITDQINLMGTNPLIGPNDDEFGPRFVDMAEAYDGGLLATARAAAIQEGIDLKEGVYVGVLGPSYETPAEIRFLSTIADVVGMSMVPEVIVARHSGVSVLGLAVVTNTPDSKHKVSHDEVLVEAQKSSGRLIKLIVNVLEDI
ncbi:MAG: purine-nucleoside phosphorylase [Actinobacteria bacterium]|nr:purine-nucleoside phosphorylase [Actinomycetota bacterium]